MKVLFILFFQSIAMLGFASGWHVTTRYYSLPEGTKAERLEQVYLYNGFMKMEGGGLTTIFDLRNSEIIYINRQNGSYWKGNPQRFVREIREELEASVEEKLVGVSAENQEEMRAIYMEMIEASFPTSGSMPQPSRSFKVQRVGVPEKVSGFSATKYTVFEEGLFLENIWIAKELTIAKDFDFVNLSNFLNQLAQGAYAGSFESSAEYFDLLKNGYPVKVEIQRGDGSIEISEVQQAVRLPMDESDFAVPKGYHASSLSQVGVWDGYL